MVKDMQNILAIIPARGGSKGIPRKNIKLLAGKPLIAYTIEAALKSNYVTRVVVSTDDDEIADVSRSCGAEIIKRPEELAKDESPTIDTIFQVLESFRKDNCMPDLIVLLQPTSPLRTTENIDNALKLFFEKECESLVGVCVVEHPPYWCFTIEDNYLIPIFKDECLKKRRQDIPCVYRPNGAIFISTPDNLYKYAGFYSTKILPYCMPSEKSIDIDSEMDFKLAEMLLRDNKF